MYTTPDSAIRDNGSMLAYDNLQVQLADMKLSTAVAEASLDSYTIPTYPKYASHPHTVLVRK